jgi:hypothetical protein
MNNVDITNMSKKFVLLLAFGLPASYEVSTLSAQPASAYRVIKNEAFTFGEKLEYRVHYGIVNAGFATLHVNDKPEVVEGRKSFKVMGEGNSISAFDWFFKVRDKYESYIDQEAIIPWKFVKSIQEGGYRDSDFILFNHNAKKAGGKKGILTIPENTQDVISAIYYARCIDLSSAKVGDVFPLTFYLDNKTYDIKIKYLGKEQIKTSLGTFNSFKIRPQVVADRVFKDEDGMTIWVSEDANKVPLRIQTELAVGSIKADLHSYSGLRNTFSAKIK